MIRLFTPDDYDSFVAISNAVYPDYPTSVEDEREGDAGSATTKDRKRWVIEDESGSVVGMGEYQPKESDLARYNLELYVHPEQQGKGYGKRLFEHLFSQIVSLQADPLHVDEVKEDLRGLRFLAERGFQEVMRFWEARLDVTTFDPAPYEAVRKRMEAQDIRIRTLQDLEGDPERNARLYDLVCDVSADVPNVDAYKPPSFEEFCAGLPAASAPESGMYFVAVQKERYIGLHIVTPRGGTDHLRTAMIGVRRAQRRQGVALALKLEGIAYAGAHAHPVMRTMNETGNEGIIALNTRLGFVKQPAWIQMVYRFDAG